MNATENVLIFLAIKGWHGKCYSIFFINNLLTYMKYCLLAVGFEFDIVQMAAFIRDCNFETTDVF